MSEGPVNVITGISDDCEQVMLEIAQGGNPLAHVHMPPEVAEKIAGQLIKYASLIRNQRVKQ